MMFKKEDIKRFIRFGIVGVIAVAIHYGVYYILLNWMSPSLSYALGYIVSFCVNYVLTTFFTFRSKSTARNAVGFSVSHVINFFLELGILNLLLLLGMEKQLSGFVTMIAACPINFLLLRFVYCRKR